MAVINREQNERDKKTSETAEKLLGSFNLYGEKISNNLQNEQDLSLKKRANDLEQKKVNNSIKALQEKMSDLNRANHQNGVNAMHAQSLLMLVMISQSMNSSLVSLMKFHQGMKEKELDELREANEELINSIKDSQQIYKELIAEQKGGLEFADKYKDFQENYAKLHLNLYTSEVILPKLKLVDPKKSVELEEYTKSAISQHRYNIDRIAKDIRMPNEDGEPIQFKNLEDFEALLNKIERKDKGESKYREGITEVMPSATDIISNYITPPTEGIADVSAESFLNELSPELSNFVNGAVRRTDEEQEEFNAEISEMVQEEDDPEVVKVIQA